MDSKELMELLKIHGLEVAEDVATTTVRAVFATIPTIIKTTPTPFDDLLLPMLPAVEKVILDLCDKIDGEEG